MCFIVLALVEYITFDQALGEIYRLDIKTKIGTPYYFYSVSLEGALFQAAHAKRHKILSSSVTGKVESCDVLGCDIVWCCAV